MTLLSYGGKLTRDELAQVPTPAGTATHKPIPHIEVVVKLVETLGFRQIGVVREEYAVSNDGMRMFGVMDLTTGFEGCRFALGLRNSHDKSFRLSCTAGVRVFVCQNLAFHGELAPGGDNSASSFCRFRSDHSEVVLPVVARESTAVQQSSSE